ncbi:MAG: hypothetical protein AB7P07_11180 [Hyphomonadaceae bacterium]
MSQLQTYLSAKLSTAEKFLDAAVTQYRFATAASGSAFLLLAGAVPNLIKDQLVSTSGGSAAIFATLLAFALAALLFGLASYSHIHTRSQLVKRSGDLAELVRRHEADEDAAGAVAVVDDYFKRNVFDDSGESAFASLGGFCFCVALVASLVAVWAVIY